MRDPPLATVVPRGRPAPARTPPCPLAAFGGAGGRGIRNVPIRERYHVSRCLRGAIYYAPGGVTARLGDTWVPMLFPKPKVLFDLNKFHWKIKPVLGQFPNQSKLLPVKGLLGS